MSIVPEFPIFFLGLILISLSLMNTGQGDDGVTGFLAGCGIGTWITLLTQFLYNHLTWVW